ncbi:hypothetical protein GCK32_017672 [Trichostrongylus colubriformis]|uniref:C2H2-type domain-containing protein n=1 Tax=Trichostrongylus colubriformis TaxID=6319 RepID=A0AAN8IU97_TRICO
MYTPKERRRLECPICQVRLTSQEHLANHCRLYHDDEACVVEERSFNNHMEFEAWKEETEKKFLTFWQLAGKSDHGRHHITYYKCYRCRRQAVDKKRLVTPSCTSFMRKHVDFAKNSGGILVKFCTRHINHDVSAASLPLSKSDKNVITQYLRKGFGTRAIRKQLHELYTDPNVRLHYVSSSDIRKVRASLQSSLQLGKFEGFRWLSSSLLWIRSTKD